MATVNVGEKDFENLVGAIWLAVDGKDLPLAKGVDKLARKMNAALSNQKNKGRLSFNTCKSLTWQEVPSPLETYITTVKGE